MAEGGISKGAKKVRWLSLTEIQQTAPVKKKKESHCKPQIMWKSFALGKKERMSLGS